MSDNRSGVNTDLMAFDLNDFTFDPSVTLLGSSFENGVTVSGYPFADDFGTDVLAGANLLITQITQVPEPGTLALFLLGVFGLARSRLTGRV
jgi:hypothetical protein